MSRRPKMIGVVGVVGLATLLWTPGFRAPNGDRSTPGREAAESVKPAAPVPSHASVPPAHSRAAEPVGARAVHPNDVPDRGVDLEPLDLDSSRHAADGLATDDRAKWRLPPDAEWPREPWGEPVVRTERVDRLFHEVAYGETAAMLRDDYELRHGQLAAMNPGVDLDGLEEGQKVIVWERDADDVSESSGAPDWGRLRHGEPLPRGDGYRILYHHRTFGTYYTVAETKRALDAYDRRFPDAHRLMVGDISFRHGGFIGPHESHRSGRDVDISYPRRFPPPDLERFHRVSNYQLDARRTLFLVRKLLERGYVEDIFMERDFQRLLVEEARRQGAPERWIDRVFEYPSWDTEAIVQHAPGHRNHMHVRFRCQPTDSRCR